jgi:3-deoxy-D-manno-octulosonate 8-phosphate phosphatase (KDO 8-P phosphatase)
MDADDHMIDQALARRIRLVGFDVDGVLTDGGVYLGMVAEHPVELKRFDIQDGVGIKLLRDAGLIVVLASARCSEATSLRARELKVDEAVQHNRKLPAFEDVLRRRGVSWDECAFVGDDVPDLPLLRRAGLPIAVANAVREVREAARIVTAAAGGRGAAREVAELLLRARNEWDALVERYLQERSDVAPTPARSD